jgi:hypothetical protein
MGNEEQAYGCGSAVCHTYNLEYKADQVGCLYEVYRDHITSTHPNSGYMSLMGIYWCLVYAAGKSCTPG